MTITVPTGAILAADDTRMDTDGVFRNDRRTTSGELHGEAKLLGPSASPSPGRCDDEMD